MLTGSSPILVAADVPSTVRFYTGVLGFTSSWVWGEPPTIGAATWGTVTIMFSQMPDLVGKVEGHEHWLDVEDVNALHALHLERGAMIVSDIEDKPWGRREYTVRDPNGYYLRFAGDASYVPVAPTAFPTGVEILRRKPTLEEYQQVVGSAVYNKAGASGVFERSWAGVVATDPAGEVIGTVRVMYDAPGWFSIWDVAVLPDWQGQRIGTAMMEAALEIVREESPGAFVYLFTYRHEFYERIGFDKGSVDIVKV